MIAKRIKHLLRGPYYKLANFIYDSHQLDLPPGQQTEFYIGSKLEAKYFFPKLGEKDILNNLLSALQKDDIVWDIGSHIGIYTCVIGNYLDSGKVIAIEPLSTNISTLEANVELNNLNVQTIQAALGDENDTIPMYINSDLPAAVGTFEQSKDDVVNVEVVRGDNLVTEGRCPQPDVVKLDIEGAELSALRGMRRTLGKCRVVLCEVHPPALERRGDNPLAIQDLLESCGFGLTIWDDDGSYHIMAEK